MKLQETRETIRFFEDGSAIRVVNLCEWLDWTGGNIKDQFVALPMIQRGSVWKPNQIIDLWDSLLRGMPVGSMLVSEIQPKTDVVKIGKSELTLVPEHGGLGLLDGQQRTLAMLIAWPSQIPQSKCIWVDFLDDPPPPGQMFGLRVTTEFQPFGFKREAPVQKLELRDRRTAWENFTFLHGKNTVPTLENATPFTRRPGLPVKLGDLLARWKTFGKHDWIENELNGLRNAIAAKLTVNGEERKWESVRVWATLTPETITKVERRVESFYDALDRLNQQQIPLIRVDPRFFEHKETTEADPPLAILFRRVGTGGTKLSDDDYAYSLIKHIEPTTYRLVEQLHGSNTVAALLTDVDLVMSGVRLAAATWQPKDTSPVPDYESPSKQDFLRILRRGEFIKDAFLPIFEGADPSRKKFADMFEVIQNTLEYRKGTDIGLPKQMFPLLGRPLVQVLLRLVQCDYLNTSVDPAARTDVLRLVLFWIVAVTDQRGASRKAYQLLDRLKNESEQPGIAIRDKLINDRLARRLPTPDEIKQEKELVFSPTSNTTLRCASRFEVPKDASDATRAIYEFYHKGWWASASYVHPILLWLQRDMVAMELDTKGDPLAGRGDDTPYDYDHILPYNLWGNWTGVGGNSRLLDFAGDDRKLSVIGDAIGNVRVWDSILNRADHDDSPRKKLHLDCYPDPCGAGCRSHLARSCIDSGDAEDWRLASGGKDCSPEESRVWTLERALAFQRVVERRTFSLYEKFYLDSNQDVPPKLWP